MVVVPGACCCRAVVLGGFGSFRLAMSSVHSAMPVSARIGIQAAPKAACSAQVPAVLSSTAQQEENNNNLPEAVASCACLCVPNRPDSYGLSSRKIDAVCVLCEAVPLVSQPWQEVGGRSSQARRWRCPLRVPVWRPAGSIWGLIWFRPSRSWGPER